MATFSRSTRAANGYAFEWGNRSWEPAEQIRAALCDGSLPADAPLDGIADRLLQRGLTSEEAASLVAWLGSDARFAAG